MARYKRTGFLLAGTGLVIGLAAVVLWPQLKRLFQNPAVKGMLPGTQVGSQIWDGQKWVHEDDYIDPNYVDSLPYNRMLRGL
jgi:hypothetical protein